jgi:hypothetical protein
LSALAAAVDRAEALAAVLERLRLKTAEGERPLEAGRPKEALALLTLRFWS